MNVQEVLLISFTPKIEPPSQKEPQRSTGLAPNFRGNLFDPCLAGLQEMHSAFNAQTFEIRYRRLATPLKT